VRQYVDAFNSGDAEAQPTVCADPMQILDGMSPHVWQGSEAAQEWYRDALAEGEHLGVTDYRIELGEHGTLMSPATMGTSSFLSPSRTTFAAIRSIKRVHSSQWRFAKSKTSGD
jgi:hypothetical protein